MIRPLHWPKTFPRCFYQFQELLLIHPTVSCSSLNSALDSGRGSDECSIRHFYHQHPSPWVDAWNFPCVGGSCCSSLKEVPLDPFAPPGGGRVRDGVSPRPVAGWGVGRRGRSLRNQPHPSRALVVFPLRQPAPGGLSFQVPRLRLGFAFAAEFLGQLFATRILEDFLKCLELWGGAGLAEGLGRLEREGFEGPAVFQVPGPFDRNANGGQIFCFGGLLLLAGSRR